MAPPGNGSIEPFVERNLRHPTEPLPGRVDVRYAHTLKSSVRQHAKARRHIPSNQLTEFISDLPQRHELSAAEIERKTLDARCEGGGQKSIDHIVNVNPVHR